MGYRAIIREIRIKNFRSIVEATIPLDNFNIFVGLNDCGKSNVLKALNLFFNGETEAGHSLDFKRDYCQHGRTGKGKAKEIVIEVSIQVPEEFSEAGIKKWKKVWRDNKLHEDNFTTLFRQYSKCATLFSRIHFEYIPAVKSDVLVAGRAGEAAQMVLYPATTLDGKIRIVIGKGGKGGKNKYQYNLF